MGSRGLGGEVTKVEGNIIPGLSLSNSLEQGGAEDEDTQVPQRVSSQSAFSSSQSPGSQEASCLLLRAGLGTGRSPGQAWVSAWQPSWCLGLGPECLLGIPLLSPTPGGHVTWRQVPSAIRAKFCWWSFGWGRVGGGWEKPGCEWECPAPGPQSV